MGPDCERVELSELYDAPLQFDGMSICTEGYLLLVYPYMLLVENLNCDDSRAPLQFILEIDEDSGIDRASYASGDRVHVSGTVDVWEDCYRNYILGEPNDDGSMTFCGLGTDVPIVFSVTSVAESAAP